MKSAILTAFVALALAGCQSSRMASLDTRPEPLAPAPSGTIVAGQLPPPSAPTGPTDPSAFPAPPGSADGALPGTTPEGGVQVAAAPPANAPDVSAGSAAGVWNASVSGQSCKVATPQTKFGSGFRAGPLRCPPPLDGVKSWNVAGKQLALYDQNGGVLARLYASGGERFDGQMTSGQPISLSR